MLATSAFEARSAPAGRRLALAVLLALAGGSAAASPMSRDTASADAEADAKATSRPGGEAVAPAEPPRHPDVVLVTFDTTRRDHISSYGHERLTTPVVDGLAAEGVRFTDCQAVIPVTGPSHASILTGLYPHVHGAFRNGVPLPEGPALLPEILASAGYRTGAFVAGWTLKAKQSGLGRGFDVYDDDGMDERYSVVNLMRRAEDVTNAALAWTTKQVRPEQAVERVGETSASDGAGGHRGGSASESASSGDAPAERAASRAAPSLAAAGSRPPLFLFVHYFDPHEPFEAPLTATPPENPAADGGPALVKHQRELDAYDREIAYADRELGRLLDGLRELGVLDDAVVAFTTDHGQSFGEHGYGGPEGAHGRHVYQSTLAAPLVIWAPGRAAAGRTCDAPVTHLDLMPTLAELAGLPPELQPIGHQGDSLVPLLEQPDGPLPWAPAKRIRYGLAFRGAVGNKWNIFRWMQNKDVDRAMPLELCAIVDGTKVLFRPGKRHRYQVFDLAADPGELHPLKDRDDRYRPIVASTWAWYETTRTDFEDVEPSPEELEALRSLGYVE